MSGAILPQTGSPQTTTNVALRDLLPQADPAQALEFLETLHRDAQGHVLLTLIGRGGSKRVRTGSAPWPEARAEIVSDPAWWRFCTDDYARWDTYAAVCSFKKAPAKGSRGLTQDVLELPGVFADLDVKPDHEGVFRTTGELDAFLGKLPQPTMRVDTGSGGAHVYWLLHERLSGLDAITELLDGWYDYLTHVAGAHTVDHVQEASRILRVPGTVRWPRGHIDNFKKVTLRHADGPRYAREDLLELTAPHHVRAVERHVTMSGVWRDTRTAQEAWLESLGLPGTKRMLLEEKFNQLEDWERLLVPLGWQLTRDRRDGSGKSTDARYWTRPGKAVTEGGSASTDSPRGHPGTMYIYTTDPALESCLVPDKNRFRRITTKYHFALHFHFGGDEAQLLKSIIEGGGRLS